MEPARQPAHSSSANDTVNAPTRRAARPACDTEKGIGNDDLGPQDRRGIQSKYFLGLSRHKIPLNSFVINTFIEKPSSNFVDFRGRMGLFSPQIAPCALVRA
jgi:hypothetical protein